MSGEHTENGTVGTSMTPCARLGRAKLRCCFVAFVTFLALVALIATQLAMSAPAGASPSKASSSYGACPPNCGRVAAGNPLLVPFMTNPGPGWEAFPDTAVEAYTRQLQQFLEHVAEGATINVAVAKWQGAIGGFQLLIILISSPSLQKVHLRSPVQDAHDLCSLSFRGYPSSALQSLTEIPKAVSGQCIFPRADPAIGTPASATVVAFTRADSAALIEITAPTLKPIPAGTATGVAYAQYENLPAAGVPVSSNNFDPSLVLVWLAILAAAIFGVVRSARRRGTWRGPLQEGAKAFGRRKLALGVSLVGVVGAMAFAMTDSSVVHGGVGWYNVYFGDFWETWVTSANITFSGGFGHVYVLDRALETAPAMELFVAPFARLGLHLSFPLQTLVLYPTAFLIAAPLFLSAMALPICAGDRLLSLMGVTDLRRRLVVLGTMAATLPTPALNGHPEDLVALGAMLYGLVAALEGRHRAVGWWLGTALAFQFLAFFAVPVALVLLKRRKWLGAVVPMILVPLGVLLIPLVSAPTSTTDQLLHQKVFDTMGNITPIWHLDPGVGAFVRLLIALAAIPAAVLVAHALPKDRRRTAANLVVWTVAVLFALRAFEPELTNYFLAPALALSALSASRAPWWRLLSACLASLWLTWWLHDPMGGRWSEWLLLLAQLSLLVWLAWPTNLRSEDRGAQTAATKRPAPAPAAVRRSQAHTGLSVS